MKSLAQDRNLTESFGRQESRQNDYKDDKNKRALPSKFSAPDIKQISVLCATYNMARNPLYGNDQPFENKDFPTRQESTSNKLSLSSNWFTLIEILQGNSSECLKCPKES